MPVYAANILDIAKPVEEVKEKKVRSEKQIAAFAKAAESRKRKKEEKEAAAKLADQEEEAAKIAEEEKVKAEAEAKEKKKQEQREKRAAKKRETTEPDGFPPKKRIAIGIDDSVTSEKVEDDKPPKWFEQYIQGVKKEENSIAKDKKPAKVVRIEAKESAQQHWNNGLTRDRVKNEVDGHMDRLYTQIFANRRM